MSDTTVIILIIVVALAVFALSFHCGGPRKNLFG
jgi:hypothetical protein